MEQVKSPEAEKKRRREEKRKDNKKGTKEKEKEKENFSEKGIKEKMAGSRSTLGRSLTLNR